MTAMRIQNISQCGALLARVFQQTLSEKEYIQRRPISGTLLIHQRDELSVYIFLYLRNREGLGGISEC